MDILWDGKIKTRKEHKCHGCWMSIPTETQVYSQTVANEYTVNTLYVCNKCRDWCKDKKCNDCIIRDSAFEGYVRECIEQQ